MFKKYFKFIRELYNKQESGLALALFRITYGLVVFAEVLQIFYFRHLIFDPIPFIIETPSMVTPMLIMWLTAIFLIVLGLFTKPAVITNYILTVLFLGFTFNSGAISEHNYHIDKIFIPIALILLFMPVSRRLSLDRLIEKIKFSNSSYEHQPQTTVSYLNYIVLTLIAGLIYFDSIFYKLSSPMWMNGLGIWLPSSLPWATYLDLSFILNNEYFIKFLGYLTLLFQLTYIFFVWIKKIKVWYLLIGIGLHIGITFAYPIPWFGLAMVALYIGIIPSSFYSNIYQNIFYKKKQPELIFFFDDKCPLCHRTRMLVEYFDNGHNILFKPVQNEARNYKPLDKFTMNELLNNVFSIDKNNQVFHGVDTYHQVMQRVWVFAPFSLLLRLPFTKNTASMIYNYMAKNRITSRCTDESCNFSISQKKLQNISSDDIRILQNLSLKTIKIYGVGIFLIFLSISQLIMIQNSFLMNYIYQKINIPSNVTHNINSFVHHYKNIFYPFTGVSQHAVFMDYHFQNYNHTVTISYKDKNNDKIFLPIINEKGQASFYDTGRQWVYYSFRVNNRNFNSNIYVKGIQRYIYFWAYKNHIDLINAKFNILYKYNEVPYHWEKDLLKKALVKPWKDAGTLGWNNGVFFSNIKNLEKEN